MKKWFLLLFCFLISTMSLLQASSHPTLSGVYGNQTATEVPQTQLAGTVGTLDATFGTAGMLSGTSGQYAYATQSLPDGTFLLLSTDFTNSYLTKYKTEGVVDWSYTLTALTDPDTSILIDAQSRFLVAGSYDTVSGFPWIHRITAAGGLDSTFHFTDGASWTNSAWLFQLATQSTGKIIAVGYNGVYAMIARYNLDGSIDTSFAQSGYAILDGASGSPVLPNSPNAINSIVIDANDYIYVPYIDTTSTVNVLRLTPAGAADTGWNGGSATVHVSTGYLDGVVTSAELSELYMILDQAGDLVLAAQVTSDDIRAASVHMSTAATPGTFADFSLQSQLSGVSVPINTNSFDLQSLIATSDGTVYLIGSDLATRYMMVVACTSAGILSSTFNPTPAGPSTVQGITLFSSGSPTSSALLYSCSIAPDGQLYLAGEQSTAPGPTATSYVSRLNNLPYITPVAQFPVTTQEQGILDLSFGSAAQENYSGVTIPFNGLYGQLLRQQATTAIEMTISGTAITQGDIIVGMNGMTDSSASANMMLAFLTPEGAVDTALGSSGYLNLANASSSNEYMTAMIEDGFGNIYISGYTSTSSTPTSPGSSYNTSAILRAYPTHASLSGTAAWAASQVTTGQGVALSLQNNRALLCVDEGGGMGHITSYVLGILDTSFGDADSGTISSTSFGLHMGPCYSLAVNSAGNIFAAYVNSTGSTPHAVDVVKFLPNGSGLDTASFGSSTGIVSDIFSGHTVAPNNVRIGFTTGGNLVVGGVTSTGILVAFINATTGTVTYSFSTAISGTTSLTLTRLTGVSDGTVLLIFWDSAANDTMYIARVVSGSGLDTTFNAQGSQPGVLPIQIGANYTVRNATSAIVQSTTGVNKGNIIVAGYESVTAADATPMAMRVYGHANSIEILDYPLVSYIPGTFETAYNLSSAPVISAGAGNVIFAYPSTNSNAGKLLIGIDNGSTSIIARVYEEDMLLDTSFGTSSSGYYTVAGSLTGVSTISVDANNNILIGGTSGFGWAQLLNNAGTSSIPFNFTTTATNIAAVNHILQQASGRYIIAGIEKTSGYGILVAFQDVASSGALQVDPTFNPLAMIISSAPYAGMVYVATTGLYAVAINPNDTIVGAYSVSGIVNIAEITADGSGFAIAGFATNVTTDSSATIRLNIDGSQNIVVGASVATSHQVQVQRFDSAGGQSTPFIGAGVDINGVQTITFAGSSSVTLTGLMETTTQQTVLTGYNTPSGGTPAHGPLFAVRLDNNGVLDATWNVDAAAPDTAGIVTYGADSAITMNSSAIANDGTIVSIASSTSDPIVTFVYGNALVAQVAQAPLQALSGTLDSTIPNNVSGALALSGLITGVPQKIYIYTTEVNSSPNGAMLIASTDSSHVYLTQLNQDLSLNSAHFGSSGVKTLTPNSSPTPTAVTVTDMYVATGNSLTTQQYIYVTGYTTHSGTNTPFAVQINPNGSGSPVYVSPASTLTSTGGIRQSSNGRVLISGYNGSYGAIVAYNPTMAAIDTTFGNGTGYYTTGVATPISTMTTDNDDRIYIAYTSADGTQIIVQRILANGTAVDSSFSATFPITGAYPTGVTNQIKMAIDLTNNMFVVAAQNGTSTGNVLQVARFNYATGGSAAGAISTITISGKALNISDLFIDSDQFIYVIGNNTTNNQSIVARVASTNSTTITLDTVNYATTSATPGIANIAIGAGLMTTITSGMLDTDGRVYLVGSNGSTLGYMGRLFNNQYWTELSPAISQGVVGALDLTLDAGNTGGIDLSLTATTSGSWNSALYHHAQAQAIIENQNGDGSSFIAFVVSGHLLVGKLNADMVPATFGTNGLTTATITMSAVNTIMQDEQGDIIVAGTQSSLQKVVLFNASGVLQATFDNTVLSATIGTTVAQQKSGRYIVGGATSGNQSAVFAYQNASAISGAALAVDHTFGPAGSNGLYTTGITGQVDDLVIDSNDYIYIVYRNGTTVNLAKLTPEGSLSTSANSPSAQQWPTNPITSTGIISATQPARIAINAQGHILIGASTNTGTADVKIALYDGQTGGTPLQAAYSLYSTNSPVLTKLVGSIGSTNEFYGAMYTTAPAAVVFAITSAGTLDTTGFNASSGYLSTQVESVTQVNGLAIQPDGKVVMVGYNGTTTPDPILIRVYGYPYISQFDQSQYQIAAGILDTTLWPTTGALELDNYSPISNTITTLSGSQLSRIYEYIGGPNNGKALLLFSGTRGGLDTVLARVNIDLTLDTTFNSLVSPGFVTISNKTNAHVLYVDVFGNIFVAGGATPSWMRGYNSLGVVLPEWLTATTLPGGALQIGNQSNSRLIVGGLGTTDGSLYGYTITGALDTTFGNGTPGIVDMGSTDPITDFTIDTSDTIITAKITGTSTVLQRVSTSGATVTPLNGGTAIGSANGSVKVILDTAGNIIVAAATSTGFTVARYNNDATATDTSGISQVNIPTASGSVVGTMYATTDGNITLVGYETTTNKVVVARLLSSPLGSTNANLVLDTVANGGLGFGTGTPAQGYIETVINSAPFLARDAFIGADDRIMIAGSQDSQPYIARVFGDVYVSVVAQSQPQGVSGTINLGFGTDGVLTYGSGTTAILAGAQGKAIFPLADAGYYQAFDLTNSNTNSILIKTLADGSLDTSYNSNGIAGNGTSTYAPLGVNSILQDGMGNVLLVGTTAGAGWLQRYTASGTLDNIANSGALAFNGTGIVNLASGTVANVAVEQTLARYVVAGANSSGAALFAYQSLAPNGIPGTADTTFNSTGTTPGVVQIGSTNALYNLVADQYDRLIFAVLNSAGSAVDLYRLTPTGELDVTFGSTGKVANAITNAAGALSVRVALDAVGNIIVAADSSITNTFSVAAYNNGTSTNAGGNGGTIYGPSLSTQLNISSLTSPTVTALVTSSEGNVLVLGTQTASGAAWIARILPGGVLDTFGFNPAAIGGIAGIFQYTNGLATANIYDALAVNADGTLSMLGYEVISGINYPTLVSVYDDPYVVQESQTQSSQPVGTIDATLGVGAISSALTVVTDGVVFYGAASPYFASYGQIAQAVALYDDNNIVVAIDGGNSISSNSQIMINMFDNDGLLNQSFGSSGTATVLSDYQNQYVNDMVTCTIGGVTKAIIAGYTYNSALSSANQYSSLLLQYVLKPDGTPAHSKLDITFGGFDKNPAGVAFGDGKKAFVVGQQSTGRIIVGGLSEDNLGLLLGYTSTGKLDNSFGNNGYQSGGVDNITGTTGIYTHAIDSQNRIVFAYNNGGTVEVARFLADGSALTTPAFTTFISTVTSDSNIKVAVDSSDNVYVAAVTNGGNTITVNKYPATGGASTIQAPIDYSLIGGLIGANYILARTIVDTAGNIIIVAYDSSVAEKTVVMRLTNTLVPDSSFNGAGYMTYQVAGGVINQTATDAMVHPDGRIIVVGSEN